MGQTIEMKLDLKENTTLERADLMMKKMLKALDPEELDLIIKANLSQIYFELDIQA